MSRRKIKDYFLFKDFEMTFAVPAGRKHQIIGNERRDIGIAFSKNGETDFREYSSEVVYWFNLSDQRAYILDARRKDTHVFE